MQAAIAKHATYPILVGRPHPQASHIYAITFEYQGDGYVCLECEKEIGYERGWKGHDIEEHGRLHQWAVDVSRTILGKI